MRKIYINEKQEIHLFNNLLNEEAIYLGDKEDMVINWLDSKFKPMDIQGQDDLLLPTVKHGVNVLDAWGQMTDQQKSLEDLFFILQKKFQTILSDNNERDVFLRNCIKKWFNK